MKDQDIRILVVQEVRLLQNSITILKINLALNVRISNDVWSFITKSCKATAPKSANSNEPTDLKVLSLHLYRRQMVFNAVCLPYTSNLGSQNIAELVLIVRISANVGICKSDAI